MRYLAALLLFGLASPSFATRQTLRFERHLKVGDTESFTVHISGSAQFGDLDVTQAMEEKLISLAKDGSGEVKCTIKSRKVLVNGAEFKTKLDPPYTLQLDTNGVPVYQAKKVFDRNDFSQYLGVLFGRDMKPGDSVRIDQPIPDGNKHATGALQLTSVSGEEAVFEAVISVPRGSQEATILKGRIQVGTKDGKLDKIEAQVDNLDLGQAVLGTARYTYRRTG